MIKPSDIMGFLDMCYQCRDSIVPLLLGVPGIGKTRSVYDFAKEKGVKVVELYLSQMSPFELTGMTMPCDADESMKVYDSASIKSLEDGDILFLDEVLTAPEVVLNACLTLLGERTKLSGTKLPDIFIVAASNPISQRAIEAMPLQNRQRFLAVDVVAEFYDLSMYWKKKYDLVIPNSFDRMLFRGGQPTVSSYWNVMTPRWVEKFWNLYERIGYVDFYWLSSKISFDSCSLSSLRDAFNNMKEEKDTKQQKQEAIDAMLKLSGDMGVEVPEYDGTLEDLCAAFSDMGILNDIMNMMKEAEDAQVQQASQAIS